MRELNEKEKQKAESRERILEAAAKLFREQGYSATGVDQLMKEAGLTAGAFFAHFKSKQQLFDCAIEHMIRGGVERLTGGLVLENNKRVVAQVLERYVSELHRDHPEKGCLIPSVASEIGRHSKKGKETLGKHIERWAGLFERNGVERGEALRLISQAVGAVLLSRMVPEGLSKAILKSGASARHKV